ncbi:hypothetical protein A9179_11890 [Pseudomonas alcaligenes]|uniref:Transmembrane protein n=1 Tax=Aquipseudomonas alcaligenes TaxID=43263 RepID=A0ABR7S327_AQUAC|nr:hypothetical protein [Pseudomonas alcaligenes]MBC9250981.1 hypothetical protein [Pseudomonas alcaligenes]
MSPLPLANLLNDLAKTGQALISESDATVSVSELKSSTAEQVIKALEAIGCRYQLLDHAFNAYDADEIEEGDEGYLIVFDKPIGERKNADTLYLLTECGLIDHLRQGHPASCWRVMGLSHPINCKARTLSGWDDDLIIIATSSTKAPRLLVKEASNVRVVPDNVQHWLLVENHKLNESEPFHILWAQFAYEALGRCIANEVESIDFKLIFKGPPKLTLEALGDNPVRRNSIGLGDFDLLHEPTSWVYENSREAEIKHVLLSTEIARSGRSDGEVVSYFRDNIAAAFECAKIAYQMSISEVTKDTLKSLGDLRKAVTEETGKATDATRQTVAAVASALAVGLGMIVARVSVALNPWIILVVMVIAFGYVVLIALSGWHFILVQRSLRTQWQLKLYRFLSSDDYKTMVTEPVGKSERIYKWSVIGGGAVLLIAAIAISTFAFVDRSKNDKVIADNRVSSTSMPSVLPVFPGALHHRAASTAPRVKSTGYSWQHIPCCVFIDVSRSLDCQMPRSNNPLLMRPQ